MYMIVNLFGKYYFTKMLWDPERTEYTLPFLFTDYGVYREFSVLFPAHPHCSLATFQQYTILD